MVNKIIIFFSLIVFLFSLNLKAKQPTALFLAIPTTARGIGMAESYISLAEGSESVYWNPAGLTETKFIDVSASYYFLICGQSYNYIGGSYYNTDYGYFGLNLIFLRMEKFNVTDPSGETDLTADSGGFAFSAGYGYKLPFYNLSVGGNLKIFNQSVNYGNEKINGTSVGLDLGVQSKNIFIEKLNLGLVFRNIGKLNYTGGTESGIPFTFVIGSSYRFSFSGYKYLENVFQSILVSFDMNFRTYMKDGVNIGSEFKFIQFVKDFDLFFRLGVNIPKYSSNFGSLFSMGIGIGWQKFNFDYAITPLASGLGINHRFSIRYKI